MGVASWAIVRNRLSRAEVMVTFCREARRHYRVVTTKAPSDRELSLSSLSGPTPTRHPALRVGRRTS